MAEFDLERKLPSCQVTRSLLESLEKYILEKKKTLENEIGNLQSKENLTFSVTDNLGTESVGSTQQLRADRFLDSTNDVTVNFRTSWYEKNTSLSVSIRFSDDRYRSRVTVVSESDMARELAVGVYQSLSEIIERSKTMNWFFHPSHLLALFLWIVLVSLPTVGARLEYDFGIPHMFLRSVLLDVVVCIYIFLGPRIYPYTTFNSLRADRLRSFSNLYIAALVTFLLSGVLFPFIYKIFFGY